MRKCLVVIGIVAACGGGGGPSVDAESNVCSLPMTGTDAGNLTALFVQRCNVPGSMGGKKWFRAAATLPDGTMNDVQLELWPFEGAFTGDVMTGSFTIGGAETAKSTCGLCLRAMGDKGGPDQKEYFATGGTVNVTMVGAAPSLFSAEITNATFAQVDGTGAPSGTCTATIPHVKIDGTVVDHFGGGSGGGGGGGGGGNMCASTVADQ